MPRCDDDIIKKTGPKYNDIYSLSLVLLVLPVLASSLYDYFTVKSVQILTYNVFALPYGLGGCRDREERISAIAEHLRTADFDIILLQELWTENDHATIAEALKSAGYSVSDYRSLAHWACDGYLTPGMCSGLAIASKWPIESAHFEGFEERGVLWDGELVVAKGLGMVKLTLEGVKVVVINTHMVADTKGQFGWWTEGNDRVRLHQMNQLRKFVSTLDDYDVLIVGGDFNTFPDESGLNLRNSLGENPRGLSTYGHPKNTYSRAQQPCHLDHVFYESETGQIWTTDYRLVSQFTTLLDQRAVSLSDHEGYSVTIGFKPRFRHLLGL